MWDAPTVNKDSLANKLVREILARIFAGEYAIDSRLPPERALCDEFHISRGTVRQAWGILAELGVIEVRHGSGAYVQGLSQLGIPADYLPPEIAKVSLEDILCARRAIETVAAELACARISAAELKGLEKLIAQMEANIDNLPVFLKYDMKFHEAIVRASGNCPLVTAFEAIREYLRYFQVFTSRRAGDEHLALDHHRRILSALRQRNAKAAAQAARRHLDAMGQTKTKGKSTLKPVCSN
jgi:GntR family transcriptional regulator, transcriptional repressor for pyruvate dehydrogenase complex